MHDSTTLHERAHNARTPPALTKAFIRITGKKTPLGKRDPEWDEDAFEQSVHADDGNAVDDQNEKTPAGRLA